MKSKKIAIATCYYENNYGSKLQSYATTIVLDKLGYENKFLYCSNPINYMEQSKLSYYLKKIYNRDFDMKIGSIKKKLQRKSNPMLDSNLKVRENKFQDFAQKNFKISSKYKNINDLKNVSNEFDTILVGSDQLWSPSSIEHGFYTLQHINNVKKISYSTSFGVEDLDNSQIIKIQEYLSKFDSIAVREETGKRIIKKYLNRNVPVVLDPTLLLNKEEWLSHLDIKKKVVEGDYILFYFLGNNPEQHKIVNKLKKYGYPIIGLLHLDSYIESDEKIVDKALFDIDPSEFLQLIFNAKYVCTDSFHGTIFSILFHKQFVTFPRNVGTTRSVNSRIENLLNRIGLLNRYYKNEISFIDQINEKIDYKKVDNLIQDLREESLKYLEGALE